MKAIGRSKKRTSRHHRMVTTQTESERVVIRDMHDGAYVGESLLVANGVYASKLGERDLIGQANLVHEATISREIRSADDRLCVRLPESMGASNRQTALLVLSKQLGKDYKVRCHSEKGSATLGQLLALPLSVLWQLPELIIDDIQASEFRLTIDGPILSAYLGKAAIPSSSSHLDPAQAKRINVGSKPSRERLVSDLPTVNEIGRPEMTNDPSPHAVERIPMPIGGFKERDRIAKYGN